MKRFRRGLISDDDVTTVLLTRGTQRKTKFKSN